MKPETKVFLETLQRQNERIAAQQAAAAKEPALDPIREERDQERREKYGQLRAREHPSKRRKAPSSVFGYTNLTS